MRKALGCTFAATAAANGLSLYQIGQLLGHRSQQTTARYTDFLQDPKRCVAERGGATLFEAMSGNVVGE